MFIFNAFWHWFEVHTGTVNESGPYYGWWSGFGGFTTQFIAYATTLVLVYRHHNCHVRHCPWPGRPVEGTPYIACPRHHPDHKGNKRAIKFEDILLHRQRVKQHDQ